MTYEFNLVLFTVFGQLAAGIVLMIWLTGLRRYPESERRAWVAAVISGLLALVGGLPHLTSFSPVIHTLSGLGSSWMSLEILAGGIFGLLVLLRLLNVLKAALNPLLGILAIAFVLVITQIYFQNDVVPLWNTWGTIIAFLSVMLALGGVALPVLAPEVRDSGNLKICLYTFIVGVIFSSALPVFWLGSILAPVNQQILPSFTSAAICMTLTQMGAFALGGIITVAAMPKRPILAGFGAILVLVGALTGRMLFYAANIKLGI
ncbi:MAG: dimethyl sulfoxide reductase anchor subunit [Deltaproteobacteria bacterium]|jgi:DMSO reductase anchor subunit|nr:dimethyl sulfoxide reductase anchor subunit [Deltaproteobacteria bacterium]